MIYVDKDLCTGCGICVATCNRGALSLSGNAAVIDETLCTSCGCCLETCLTGAIISMEVTPQPPFMALAQRLETQSTWAGAPLLPSTGAAAATSAASQPAAISKLDVIERVFNGLVAIAAYALDRRRSRSTWLAVMTDRAGKATASTGNGGGRCPGGRQGRRTRQVHRLGYGLGGGRSPGSFGRRGDRRPINRRNRAT